jgi:hypothetical protein
MIGGHGFNVLVGNRKYDPTVEPMLVSLTEKYISNRFFGFNESRRISGKLRDGL